VDTCIYALSCQYACNALSAMVVTKDNLRALALSLGVHVIFVGVLVVGLLQSSPPNAKDAKGTVIEATVVGMPPQLAADVQRLDVEQHQNAQTAASMQADQATPAASTPNPDSKVPPESSNATDSNIEKPQQNFSTTSTVEPRQSVASSRESGGQTKPEPQATAQEAPNQPARDNAQPTQVTPPVAASVDGGVRDGLLEKYRQATYQGAMSDLLRRSVPERVHCKVHITQTRGGQVTDVQFLNCPLDDAGRGAVDEALRKTQLPYAGYESVFLQELDMDFCYPIEACAQ
jgi:colicin import membrane protein